MSVVALVGLAIFGLVAFGWRAWLQYRRTGDTGFRGFSRNPIEMLSGLGFVGGIVAVVLAPVLELGDIVEPIAAFTKPALQAVGLALFVFGLVVTVVAQLHMGRSWRVGVDPNERTELVTEGVFRLVRNPIYSGMILACLGVALMVPNVVALIGLAMLLGGLEVHVRFVEEPYLRGIHGDAYARYTSTVGRFVPRL